MYFDNQEDSDVLILAGDTDEYHHGVLRAVREVADFYPHVAFTDGNHDHYFSNIPVQMVMEGYENARPDGK